MDQSEQVVFAHYPSQLALVAFVYACFDVQVFETKDFFVESSTAKAALHRQDSSVVCCRDNSPLLRKFNARPDLDEYFAASSLEPRDCAEQITNRDCEVNCVFDSG